MSQTILVVDDSLVSRMMIKAIIEKHIENVVIIEANCGAQALEQINSDSEVDVAFVDFNMPGMTGLELINSLKNIITIPKVALLTANIQDEIRQQTHEAGVSFLNKPINEQLISTFLDN